MQRVTQDTFGRPLRNLRLSVTDRCNLRCAYCMPEENYAWLPREPLLRRDLHVLVERLASKPGIRDLAMTTNGVLLAENARALHEAGLHRLTVSLDTLRHDRFKELARFDE